MQVGVPRETKDLEFRVGLSPSSVQALIEQGHRVCIETQAGVGSGFSDADYRQAGGTIVTTATDAWNQYLIVKVKEPLPGEYDHLRADQII
ncbi:alanine dehydrogenase, partial [filamentous cyanobacterium LEGE 11480]|nr:alanine dehydrogenase [Romeriopsis navalis LEGE 11480]